jgi:hypothetical protein
VYLYYQYQDNTLTFAYSYDFEDGDQYSQSFNMASGGDTYGAGLYGTAVYAGSGGAVSRRDISGMGRVIRFKFATNALGARFQIDGIGGSVNIETEV